MHCFQGFLFLILVPAALVLQHAAAGAGGDSTTSLLASVIAS
jgi:hypothetical protein